MSKRVSKDKGTFNPDCAKENLKKYISEYNLTDLPLIKKAKKEGKPNYNYSNLEKFFLCDRRVISDLLDGIDREYSLDTFLTMKKRTGIPEAYWRGMTKETDPEKYEAELHAAGQMAELDRILEERHQKEVYNHAVFFSRLGFQYECQSNYMQEDRPHKLSSNTDPVQTVYLSDQELEDFINELQDCLSFQCFKKARQAAEQGADHE